MSQNMRDKIVIVAKKNFRFAVNCKHTFIIFLMSYLRRVLKHQNIYFSYIFFSIEILPFWHPWWKPMKDLSN